MYRECAILYLIFVLFFICPKQEMFLYKEDEVADEDYQHHPLSNSNNPSTTSSASKHNPLYSLSHHHSSAQKVRQNKQFQGYQTIMNSNIGTYGGKYTIDKKNNLSNTSTSTNPTNSYTHNNGTSSSIKKSTLRPDDDMVTTIHNRKRRIVLSDNEEGESSAENEKDSAVKGVSGGSGHKRRRANSEGMSISYSLCFHCTTYMFTVYTVISHYRYKGLLI